MINIINIIEEGRYGGPQASIVAMSAGLIKKGIKTTVVCPRKDSEFFRKKLKKNSINCIRIDMHHLTKYLPHLISYIIFFIPEVLYLMKLIKKGNFDVVQCSGGAWQIKGVLAGRLARKKVIWCLNDTSIPRIIKVLFYLLAYYFTDSFITAGASVKKYYIDGSILISKPCFVISSPVNTKLFNPKKVGPDQKILQYPGIKIVNVANINPFKGLEYFIKMAFILNKKYDNLSFIIAGDIFKSQCIYYKKLLKMKQKYSLDNLHFIGKVDDVASFLKASDIFVFTSVYEASPISVWEAMSMNMPIVSTDVGDVALFIKDRKAGFIVPCKEPLPLANKVEKLILNKSLRSSFGKKARKIAIKNLDLNIAVKKHLNVYRKILEIKNEN